jgi:hypothetical protein
LDFCVYSVRTVVLGILLAALSGCEGPASGSGRPGLTRQSPRQTASQIAKVVCFFSPPPRNFKSFDAEGDPNPEGFACSAFYLISRETGKGVLADGTLNVKMYRLQPGEEGKPERELVHEWTAAMNSLPRSNKPSAMGWGYAPVFNWGDADVLGAEIELVFEYESPDGYKVRSQTHHFKVPSRKL